MLARSFLQVRRAGPRALLGVGLERVLLAGVLCVTGVFVASGGVLWRLWACLRIENSGRASGALAASRDVFVSLDKFQASRSESSHLAALVVVQNPRSAWRPRHGAVFLVATTLVSAGRALGSRTCASRLHSASEMDWFGILASCALGARIYWRQIT